MKKLIALLLMVTMLLPVSACGKEKEAKEEYLTLTASNVEQYVKVSVIMAKEITNERVEGSFRLGDSGLQVVVEPIDPTKTIIDSISVRVYIDSGTWSVAGRSEKELEYLLNGFYGSFPLSAETILVGTPLYKPDAEDVTVTITSVSGTHYYE